MRCIIIDDEKTARMALRKLCEKMGYIEVLQEFENPTDAIAFIQQEELDLIFLDIHMPELKGSEFVKTMSSLPDVIMTTTDTSFALEEMCIRDRVIGARLSETIIPHEYREAHERGMKHFLKTGEGPVLNQRIEITAINAKGTIFPVELTIIPNQIDGVYFFSSFVRDLSESKKTERLLKAINDLAISLLGKTSIEEIAWEITKNTIDELGFEDCIVYVLDEDSNLLKQAAAYGPKKAKGEKVLDPITIPVGKGIVGKVAQIGAPVIIDDTSQDPDYIVDDDNRFSELAVPIIEGDKVIGVIDSEHPEKNFYTEEHLQTLSTIASMVSTQLGNAILEQKRLKAEQSLKESEERRCV